MTLLDSVIKLLFLVHDEVIKLGILLFILFCVVIFWDLFIRAADGASAVLSLV